MVTQKQIAEMAGVSFATVSRALTHSAKVRPDTLQRIRSAMQALGVNNCDDFFLGRSTLSKMVLVIVGDIATEFFANIVIGISGHHYDYRHGNPRAGYIFAKRRHPHRAGKPLYPHAGY